MVLGDRAMRVREKRMHLCLRYNISSSESDEFLRYIGHHERILAYVFNRHSKVIRRMCVRGSGIQYTAMDRHKSYSQEDPFRLCRCIRIWHLIFSKKYRYKMLPIIVVVD